jgi:hypothetical protein
MPEVSPKTDVPAINAAPSIEAVTAAIKASDDFAEHSDAFVRASLTLLENGRCTLAQLQENGGWVRSQTHKDRPVYFTYCGASHVSNRIYVDVSTGEIFR